jgi:hypothetical protein
MDLVFAVRRRRFAVTGREKERRAITAREKRERSSLTGLPQEFPPAEAEKPTFFLKDLQATLPFRGKEKFSIGITDRQRR